MTLESICGAPLRIFRRGTAVDVPQMPPLAVMLSEMYIPTPVNIPNDCKRMVAGYRKCTGCGKRFKKTEMVQIGSAGNYIFCKPCSKPVLEKRARLGRDQS